MAARRTIAALVVAAATLATASAHADTLLKGEAGTNPLPLTGVKINGIQNGQLTYTTASGDARTAALADVQKLTVDGQPDFNAAEGAYAARNAAAAMTGYAAAVGGSGPGWLKARAAQRLADVARSQHRYDLQVQAYAALLNADPTVAAAAKPAAPPPNTPGLDAAQTVLDQALSATPAARRAPLLGIQLDIARAKGDRAAVNKTLQQLVAAGGATPADQAMLKLASADVALDAKQYAQAQSTIEQAKPLFTDPAQQVDALYVLAQARDGLAGAAPDGLKDAALAYMRVVAFGDALPGHPHAAESLLRTAELEEKLSDPKAALKLYQRLTTDKAYAAAPEAVAQAKAAVDRLKK